MSGITGFLCRNQAHLNIQVLEQMTAILAHRGPDGAGTWNQGSAGLGNRLLYTTPESLHEHQPWLESGFCITADARVDNRAELAKLLGTDAANLGEFSDSRLILAAYMRWGEDCPQRILGDFAFAIWDSHKQVLFCARDPLGVKPFYYTLTNEWFLFGSEIKAILCHPAASNRLNENWMASFLMPPDDFTDKESTFYSDIHRLPPAHTLTISVSRYILSCYWRLDPEREIHFKNEDEYAEALREKFTLAVERRLRSAFPVGSTLSGGIDSSSIACTARNLLAAEDRDPLHTFSALFKDAPNADESPYIDTVVEQGGIIPHFLHPDRTSPFVDLEQVLWHLDEPFFGPNYFMPWAIDHCAKENGVRVLMDGTDGDTIISHGIDYLDLLAKKRHWKQFAIEANAVVDHFNDSQYATIPNILYTYGTPHLTELARQGKWFAFAQDVHEVGRLFNLSPKRLAVDVGIKPLAPKTAIRAFRRLQGKDRPVSMIPPFINADYAANLSKQKSFIPRQPVPTQGEQEGRALHFFQLNLGMLPYTLEMINRLASAFSIEVRFPFCDRDLVEFCLALPPEQKLQRGWSRYTMRHAMGGIMPHQVQWRGGKISLAEVYPYMLQRYAVDYVIEILTHPPEPLGNYINLPVIRKYFKDFQKERNFENLQWVWQTIVIAVWMRQASYSLKKA